MDSLLQAADNARVVQRIESLRADTAREWGKMGVAQMLVHCQRPFLVAAGEMTMKRGLIGKLFGGLAKKRFVIGPAPFGRNSPTDPKFVVREECDFAREQGRLIELVKRFGDRGAVAGEHPFFGPMSPEDWDRLMWKHLDHHLRQFGA